MIFDRKAVAGRSKMQLVRFNLELIFLTLREPPSCFVQKVQRCSVKLFANLISECGTLSVGQRIIVVVDFMYTSRTGVCALKN